MWMGGPQPCARILGTREEDIFGSQGVHIQLMSNNNLYPYPKNTYWELPYVETTAVSDYFIKSIALGDHEPIDVVLLLVLLHEIGNKQCCAELRTEDLMKACNIKDRRAVYAARKRLAEKGLINFTTRRQQGGLCYYEILHPTMATPLPSKHAVDYTKLPDWVVSQFYQELIPENLHTEFPTWFNCPINRGFHSSPSFHITLSQGEDGHGHWECQSCTVSRKFNDLGGLDTKKGLFGGMQRFYRLYMAASDHESQIKVRGLVHDLQLRFDAYVQVHRRKPPLCDRPLPPFVPPVDVNGNPITP
jgi:hypothetical protein